MSMERIQDVIGEVQEEYIADAGYRVVRRPKAWVYWAAAAACLVLGVAIGVFAATTVMADEYTQAEAGYTQEEVDALLAQAESESGGFVKVGEITQEVIDYLTAAGFGYPVNENGQTYGCMIGLADGTVIMPDLVYVPLHNGGNGYLYAELYKEYCEADMGTQIEMIYDFDENGHTIAEDGMPAYASDGVTVIGYF